MVYHIIAVSIVLGEFGQSDGSATINCKSLKPLQGALCSSSSQLLPIGLFKPREVPLRPPRRGTCRPKSNKVTCCPFISASSAPFARSSGVEQLIHTILLKRSLWKTTETEVSHSAMATLIQRSLTMEGADQPQWQAGK